MALQNFSNHEQSRFFWSTRETKTNPSFINTHTDRHRLTDTHTDTESAMTHSTQQGCGVGKATAAAAARMMLLAVSAMVALSASGTNADLIPIAPSAANNKTLFDFNDLVDIEGRPTGLAQYRGNVSLVINVASF